MPLNQLDDFFNKFFKIRYIHLFQNLNLNFACILKCKRLIVFRINQPFLGSFDLVLKAFPRLPRLIWFTLKKDDETVEIQKRFQFVRIDPSQYMIRIGSTFFKEDIDFNELTKTGVRTRSMTKLIDLIEV